MAYLPDESRYQKLDYRRCGDSGVHLPAMSLGLWHYFGEGHGYEQARELLLGAFDRGITYFDAADNYGPPPGSAEQTLGRVLRGDLRSHRDELIIATKAGHRMWPGPYGEWGSKKHLAASIDQSLKRLGVDYVDIFYHHRPDPDTPMEETMQALADMVRQGKALYVGISKYSPEQTQRACKLLRELGTPCLVHQARYSMLQRQAEALFDVLKAEGVGCAAFSPLAQGVLTGKYLSGIPVDSRAAGKSEFLRPEQITRNQNNLILALQPLARRRGQTTAQMALAWALRDPCVTTLVLGARTLAQLDQNLLALNCLHFDEEELLEIETVLNEWAE
jgi:L-glyceraldehyde 3-phosphate reductase